MAAYTFVSSRDPVDGDRLVHDLAGDLAKAGHEVTLFLVENGTFLARNGACGDLVAKLGSAGVEIVADNFALEERGIVDAARTKAVKAVELDVLVDHLAAGRNVSWH